MPILYFIYHSFSEIDDSRTASLARELSIVEEGEDGEQETTKLKTHRNNNLKIPDSKYEREPHSAGSSNENLSKSTSRKKSGESSSRRASFVEYLSSRRPSAIMATLRRGSRSVLSSFSHSKDDPNDCVGFNSPEAIEARRKNRRVAE